MESSANPLPPAGERARLMLGASLAGGAVALSLPPWGWWPLAFVGIALLNWLLKARSVRHRILVGFFFGLCWFVPATAWMAAFTPPGFVGFGFLSAVWYAVAFALVPPGRGRYLALPAVFVLTAAFQWAWPFGGVPLASLAMGQASGWFGQAARTFGSLTLVALPAVIGGLIAAAVERTWRVAGASVAFIAVVTVLIFAAPSGSPIGELDIAVVQGGGEQGTRALNTSARKVFERHLEATETLTDPVDLILWPENVITVRRDFTESPEFGELAAVAAEKGAPVLAGIVEQQETTFFNASEVVEVDGSTGERYDKVQRVPFGEYVPFRSLVEWAAPEYLPRRNAEAGTGPAVVHAADATLGVSISWEIFFDRRARDAIENGGEVLLNPTNGSSYSFTIVQSQQIAASQLRAIETGRWVAQAAPTGFSAIITPDGDIVERTDVSEQRIIVGTLERRTGITWAVRFGQWPALISAALALLASWGIARRSQKGDPATA